MTAFFEKTKKPYFGDILSPFCQNLGKNEFSWEKGLSVFRYSNYLLSCLKYENYWAISEKNAELTDGQTDTRIDGQTDNGDFIGPSVARGSNKSQ